MRGHIRYDEKGGFFYFKCFNFGCPAEAKAWPADKWLKFTSKELHSQYIREILQPKNEEKLKKKLDSIKIKRPKKEKEEKDNLGRFIRLNTHNTHPLVTLGVQYCTKRQIQRSIWEKWYVSTEGKYKDRLIIPFYDRNNQIYYWQGRSLKGQYPKYLNREKGKDNAIYNWDFIDKTHPVFVFEGIIDSLFIPGSIAILGLNISDKVQEKINTIDARYIMDNDESGIRKSKELLKQGKYVFIWKEFLKAFGLPNELKDMNEVIMYGKLPKIDFRPLTSYCTNSWYDVIKL